MKRLFISVLLCTSATLFCPGEHVEFEDTTRETAKQRLEEQVQLRILNERTMLRKYIALRAVDAPNLVNGDTLLIECVRSGRYAHIPWLLNEGANPLITNHAGESALSLAKLIPNPHERDLVLKELAAAAERFTSVQKMLPKQVTLLSKLRAAINSDHAFQLKLPLTEKVTLGSPEKISDAQLVVSIELMQAFETCEQNARLQRPDFLATYRHLIEKMMPLPKMFNKLTIRVGKSGDFWPLDEYLSLSLANILKKAGYQRLIEKDLVCVGPMTPELQQRIKTKLRSLRALHDLFQKDRSSAGFITRLDAFEKDLSDFSHITVEGAWTPLSLYFAQEARFLRENLPKESATSSQEEKKPQKGKRVHFAETVEVQPFKKELAPTESLIQEETPTHP